MVKATSLKKKKKMKIGLFLQNNPVVPHHIRPHLLQLKSGLILKRMASLVGDKLLVFCYFELNIFYSLKIFAIRIEHKLWLIDLYIFLVFNTTLSNMSAISWRPVLVVEETWLPGENHRPWASNMRLRVECTPFCMLWQWLFKVLYYLRVTTCFRWPYFNVSLEGHIR